jgi:Phosphotransferase enzyme family
MASLAPRLLEWAVRVAAPGAEVVEVRGLRDGGSPWLVRLGRRGGRERGVVLRVGGDRDRPGLRTEVAALELAAEHDLPAPRLLAAEPDRDPPVVLVERLEGSSAIPADRPAARLRTLGRTAARLHAVALAPGPALPRRDRPIASVDFAALRRRRAARGRPGVAALRRRRLLRHGRRRRRPAGLGGGAGRPAADLARWDAVAALSTPPDMGWLVGAIAGQGRGDLTRDVLVRRRDAFLRDALDRLDAERG